MQARRKLIEADEKNSERATCSICLERKPNAQLNNCLHIFCLKCIRRWSKKHSNCPLCRRAFTIIQNPLSPQVVRSMSVFNTIEGRFPSGLALVMPVFYFSTPLQPLYMNQDTVCLPYYCSGMPIFTSVIYNPRQSIPSLF